jgi:hypothetical protein
LSRIMELKNMATTRAMRRSGQILLGPSVLSRALYRVSAIPLLSSPTPLMETTDATFTYFGRRPQLPYEDGSYCLFGFNKRI